MKTVVEWLYERLERMIPRTALYNIDKKEISKVILIHNEEQFSKGNLSSILIFVNTIWK